MNRPVLQTLIFTLSLASPAAATAQSATQPHRWSLAGAGGLGYTGAPGYAIGFAWAFSAERQITDHLAARLVFDGAGSQSRSRCLPALPPSLGGSPARCTTDPGSSVFSFSLGGDWVALRDRGFFGAGRVGIYQLGDASGIHPGAYLGGGFAVPMTFGALVFETGFHFYTGRTQQNWVVPALVGLRWRL